ncbi:basic 7S globulin 2-like [Herrania umbratica]|uniref:Basic 7S globulin 2-like n=1 Tax=Herrania umbratica TaxID=108875 RepID=A0A6J1AX49_9ROSI|nr:basic 7S globulin 2-like [Herrania umbratica]
MASPFHLLLFFSFLSSLGNTFPVLGFHSNSVFFPVIKDAATLQYVARISHGTPSRPNNLVVDLGGPFLWMDCDAGHVSLSNRLISSCSVNCSKAKFHDHGSKSTGGCLFNTNCNVFLYNGITGLTAKGELVEDIIAVDSVGRLEVGQIQTVDTFLFSCAPTFLLQGLASGSKGTLGLGKASISLPSQLSSSIGHPQKIFLCLSSSDGVVLTGNGHPLFGTKITRSLVYAPLITKQHDYFINVQSIKINGKRLAVDKSMLLGDEEGKLGTKLSTIVPYTTMKSSIYAIFSKAYGKAAESMNMTRVAAVAPFELCFSSKGVENTILGPLVPEIDLVLQSEMVKWRIQGRNSMVKVSNQVMCLGFLDGGLEQSSSIVIGGLQLEDNLLEFDVGSSMLGFSSSLLLKETTCSTIIQDSKLKQCI